jgi:ketosteroid isomerase-like protein
MLVLLGCVAALGCESELTTRERAVEEQVVTERLNAWAKAMNNARQDSIAAFYLHDPSLQVLWANGTHDNGWEEAQQSLRDFYNSIQYMNFVLQNPEVDVLAKGVAVSTFRHSTDVVERGGLRQPVTSGRGVVVWIKDSADGLWRIYLQQTAATQVVE